VIIFLLNFLIALVKKLPVFAYLLLVFSVVMSQANRKAGAAKGNIRSITTLKWGRNWRLMKAIV